MTEAGGVGGGVGSAVCLCHLCHHHQGGCELYSWGEAGPGGPDPCLESQASRKETQEGPWDTQWRVAWCTMGG